MPEARPRAVFAGLATLDVIHRVTSQPGPNQKVTALAQFVAAGGPAANAAVTFAALGGDATLVTALGKGSIAHLIADELTEVAVHVVDVGPDLHQVPVSSVAVNDANGDRSVIGGDAAGTAVPAPAATAVEALLLGADVLLLDGHYPDLANAMADAAKRVPIVVDAGRWKPSFAELIPKATDIVASADFRVPGSSTSTDTATRLIQNGAPIVVVTAGGNPTRWWNEGRSGEVATPQVQVADTLGAGDVFHGAYAFALAQGAGIEDRVAFAAEVAATRCAHTGPRSWLDAIAMIPLPRGSK